jgi:hypothetical protein
MHHSLVAIFSPLELVLESAFIPLSWGGYFVTLGDYMLLDSILG